MKHKKKLVQLRVESDVANLIAFACRECSFKLSESALDAKIAGNMMFAVSLRYEAERLRKLEAFITECIKEQVS